MVLPGGPLEICFSFDTTWSMTSYVDQVKARLQDMVQKLKSDIPGIKIALFAHGDYYHKEYKNKNPYVTRHIDFSDDVAELCTFIKDAAPTEGGDWDECYELVMKQAREQLTWTPGTNRVLVMIGDATPHDVRDYGVCFDAEKIYWKQEVKKLLESNIRCYGVFCNTDLNNNVDKRFFQTLSKLGKGSFLELKNFDSIFDFMMAICYREHGEDALFAYEDEIKGRTGGAAKDVNQMFTTLKKSVSDASTGGVNKTRGAAKLRQKNTNVTKLTTPQTKPSKGKKGLNIQNATKKLVTSETEPQLRGIAMRKASRSQRTRQKSVATKTTVKPQIPVSGNKALHKPKFNTSLKRLRREKVPETNFALRYFPWSSWKLVISSKLKDQLIPKVRNTSRKGKHSEYAVPVLFKGKTKCSALYEVAVRLPGCKKKVVYVKSCSGFMPSQDWRKVLFPSASLNKQVKNVVQKQGADIYVRRLVLKNYRKYSDIPSTLENYEYVWAPAKGTKKYRELRNGPFVISAEMDVD